jgi:hypothetical protein
MMFSFQVKVLTGIEFSAHIAELIDAWDNLAMVIKMNFQRKGSSSNSAVGSDFESLVAHAFETMGVHLEKNIPIEIGTNKKKIHRFDLGSSKDKILIECKSHTWTETGNMPSAKITTWNQAMYYFMLSPIEFRKVFVVAKSNCNARSESLAHYYVRLHSHLIPVDVEFWELDEELALLERLH